MWGSLAPVNRMQVSLMPTDPLGIVHSPLPRLRPDPATVDLEPDPNGNARRR